MFAVVLTTSNHAADVGRARAALMTIVGQGERDARSAVEDHDTQVGCGQRDRGVALEDLLTQARARLDESAEADVESPDVESPMSSGCPPPMDRTLRVFAWSFQSPRSGHWMVAPLPYQALVAGLPSKSVFGVAEQWKWWSGSEQWKFMCAQPRPTTPGGARSASRRCGITDASSVSAYRPTELAPSSSNLQHPCVADLAVRAASDQLDVGEAG